MVNKIITWSTFQTKAIYDDIFRQVYETFGIEIFQKDQQKAIDMFFEGNDVSVSLLTGYGKSPIYQAAPVIDRLSLCPCGGDLRPENPPDWHFFLQQS